MNADSSVLFDITYKDDEDDLCIVNTDSCLRAAVDYARTSNLSTLKIQVDVHGEEGDRVSSMRGGQEGDMSKTGRGRSGSGLGKFVQKNEQAVIIGGGVALAAGLMGMMLFMRKNK